MSVFSHFNKLFTEQKNLIFEDTINIIDYETMDINFEPVDIASYFNIISRSSRLIPGKI